MVTNGAESIQQRPRSTADACLLKTRRTEWERAPRRLHDAVTELHVEVLGQGEPAVLVHGSGPREQTWADQVALASRHRLLLPDRRGYGRSPVADPDFEVDAMDVAELLGEGAHLVGFSYGGVGSLLAAVRRPQAVRSLTVIEPAAFGVARGDAAVEKLLEGLVPLYQAASTITPEQFDRRFDAALGLDHPPEPLNEESRTVVEANMRERPPWEAEIRLDDLAGAPFPSLVVSGGWNSAFDAVCTVLARTLNADRADFPEYGSHGVQHARGFNERLEAFWRVG